ncbi:MAG: glycine cleavage system aminomethyltransferase GcvT [Bacillota bacterium]
MDDLKKTSFFKNHKKLGAKIIDFSGWALPVRYESIKKEHLAVRNNAGLFDVSHMGEIIIKGKQAQEFVDYLITNNAKKLKDFQIAYTLMCYKNGGVVDDLLVYKYDKQHFYLVVNASNIEKDFEWIKKHSKKFDVNVENDSKNIAQLAIQGPKAQEILQKLTKTDLDTISFFNFKPEVSIDGKKTLVSRTGYTGEDGFELYFNVHNNQNIEKTWDKLLSVGKELGLKPVGLGARDTLRFEVALPLYGHEISKEITPLEARLNYFIDFDKKNFLGKEALLKQKDNGVEKKLVGLEITKGGIARQGYKVYKNDKEVGIVTTGYLSPSLKKKVALALVDTKYSELGQDLEVKNKRRFYKAKVVKKKFYNKKYKK